MFSVGVNVPFNDDSRLKLMYSFDMITSDLKKAGKNAHEISLIYEFDKFSFFGDRNGDVGGNFRGGRYRDMDCCPF